MFSRLTSATGFRLASLTGFACLLYVSQLLAQQPNTMPPTASDPLQQPAPEPPGDPTAPPVEKAAEPVTEPVTDPKALPAEKPVEPVGTSEPPAREGPNELRFSFEGTPWRDVIRWLAQESELALHVGELPTGSLTYSDPNPFTEQAAIDRVNLFLLPQGFTLVRSGQLLSVINLGDPRSRQQLDSIAKQVTVQELDALSGHEVVKCLFPLGEIKAEDAVAELSPLNLMAPPSVFAKTNQLMITDTANKLKNVKAILGAFETTTLDNGTVVKSFSLEHVDAEDILVVARPHLGLATGEMIGIDVSLSADLQGKHIFVTGVEDKVKLIENLVNSLDKKATNGGDPDGLAELKSHSVQGGNVETVYNVLLTLLAGKSVRLSMDEKAGSIVALASPEVQKEIAATVTQLQASVADFEAIPLKTIDPYFAISLLEEMLDLPDPLTWDEDEDDRDLEDIPKIDADPGNMRLFVRAKRHQIDQIKKIIEKIDVNGGGASDLLRVLPLRGKQAELVLETAAKFWRQENPVVLYESATPLQPMKTERTVNEEAPSRQAKSPVAARKSQLQSSGRWLAGKVDSQQPMIRCQLTQRGLLLQSDDSQALDRFEELIRTISGPLDSLPSPPIVFYLKFAKPVDALRTLADLIDGENAAKQGEAGSLVNGYVASSTGVLGSYLTTRDGATSLISDTLTVVADTRLNRLIAQGSAADIERDENYLKIIDKETSITSIETYGVSHVIELKNTRASEVAAALREAYAGRIAGTTGAAATAGKAAPAKPTPAKSKAADKNAKGDEKSGGAARDLEPKMTVAVHEASNSLIVTAPEPLFRQVEQLALQIDARGRRTIEVLGPVSSPAIEAMLQEVFSGQLNVGGSRSTSSSSSSRAAAARAKAGR